MPPIDPLGDTSRLELEWKNWALRKMVEMDLFLEPEFMMRQGVDFLRDEMMVGMRVKVLTDNLPPESVRESTTITIHEPASTWQTWKSNNHGKWYTKGWLPWLLTRRPVKTTERRQQVTCTVNLERFRSYPEASYRASDFRLGRVVLHHNLSSPMWDFGPISPLTPKDGD